LISAFVRFAVPSAYARRCSLSFSFAPSSSELEEPKSSSFIFSFGFAFAFGAGASVFFGWMIASFFSGAETGSRKMSSRSA
jgi:hypothetical protein